MNVEYQSGERLFEWDSDKAKRNKIKHGISFKLASRVFEDEDTALNAAMTSIPTKKNVGRLSARLKIFCSSCTRSAEEP